MVAPRLAHGDALEIRGADGDPGLGDPERVQDEAAKRRIEALVRRFLDQLPDDEISDIGVVPAAAGRIAEAPGLDLFQKGRNGPGVLAPRDRLVVGR
jgi:hypothetical protein